MTKAPRPTRRDWPALVVVALGCAIGFPLLTTLALQTSSTAHSAVVIGAPPMATAAIAAMRPAAIAAMRPAAIAAMRTRRNPSPLFWLGATLGGVTVVTFALVQNHGRLTIADLYLFAALLACAAGYAEGGRLSARLPGWQVIAWAVLLAAPVNLIVTAVALPMEPVVFSLKACAGLGYIAAISQFGGFVVWYRGMGLIGVARASQLQLAQPLLTLVWAWLLLGERLTPLIAVTALIVLGCIVITQRATRAPKTLGTQAASGPPRR